MPSKVCICQAHMQVGPFLQMQMRMDFIDISLLEAAHGSAAKQNQIRGFIAP